MVREAKVQYTIKSCPSDDTVQLENLLNSMSEKGWDLYTIQEGENDEGFCYNCFFLRDTSILEENEDEFSEITGFKTQMEKLLAFQNRPFQLCKDIQTKIKEKRSKINDIKSNLDNVSDYEKNILNDKIEILLKELNDLKADLSEVISPDSMIKKIGSEKISIGLSEELMDIVNPDLGAEMVSQLIQKRHEMVENLGYIIPHIKFIEDEEAEPNEFIINVRNVPAFKGNIYPGYLMFYQNDLKISKLPKNSIKSIDLLRAEKVIWIKEEDTKDFWTKGKNACEVLADYLEFVIIKYIEEIFDYMDTNRYIEIIADKNMYLIENIIPDFITVAELKYILCQFIKERISIKDITYIFEKINDLSDEIPKDELLSKLRTSFSRQISKALSDKNGIIQTILLSEDSLNYFDKQINNDNSIVKINMNKLKKITKEIKKLTKTLKLKKNILLVPKEIRQVMFTMLSEIIPEIYVITKEEISSEYTQEIVGYV